MNYLLKDGYVIIPARENFTVLRKDLYVANGRISREIPEKTIDIVINCRDRVIMPGLVNGHHHMYSMLSKGIPCQLPFGSFLGNLKNLWWLLDRALDEESVLLSTVLSLEDCLRHGVTTVFDHHISVNFIKGSLDMMAKAFDAYGIQGVLAFEMSDRNGSQIFEDSLAENLNFANNQRGKAVQGMLGLHASFTLSTESLQKIASQSSDLPVHIHLAEDMIDSHETLDKYDNLIIDRLNKHGLIRNNSIFVHGSNLSPNDLSKLAGKEIFLVQAVDSNLNNGLKVANLVEFTNSNIPITVGTDGMNSNILKSFKNSYLLCKYLNRSADSGYAEMAWLLKNSYRLKKAYGYDLGILQGDIADIAVIDYQPAADLNSGNFLSHWIYGITEARIMHVIKGDSHLLDDYKVTPQPYRDIISRKREITEKLFARFTRLREQE
jgi:cytosine/adenosine deaminase-related metal-dependent hydrolase